MDPDLDLLAELFNESGQAVAAGQDADLHGSASAAGSVMTASDDAFSVDDDRSRKRARTSAAVASAGAGSSFLGGMRRRAREDFRTNISQQGLAEPWTPEPGAVEL